MIANSAILRIFLKNDWKNISRDHFMIFMFAFALLIALAFRYLLPWLDGYLAETGIMPGNTGTLRFSDLYPMIVANLTIYTGALIVGGVFGFILLDENEANTLTAMRVTPVPLSYYLIYRVGVPVIYSAVIIFCMWLIINQTFVGWFYMIILSAAGSLTAPLVALYYGITAENKIQGFAMGKFASIAGWVIIVGWFVSDPWQWLFGIYPPFLLCKAYWMILAGNEHWWIALGAGILLHLLLIKMMITKFIGRV